MAEFLLARPIAPLENEGTTSKSPEDKSISSHFFLAETGQERRGRRVKPARVLNAPPSGRNEVERLDAAPALRTVAAEKMGWLNPCAACPGGPLMLMVDRIRCRFLLAGDRLLLLASPDPNPRSVIG